MYLLLGGEEGQVADVERRRSPQPLFEGFLGAHEASVTVLRYSWVQKLRASICTIAQRGERACLRNEQAMRTGVLSPLAGEPYSHAVCRRHCWTGFQAQARTEAPRLQAALRVRACSSQSFVKRRSKALLSDQGILGKGL